jgi:hypothetical protein
MPRSKAPAKPRDYEAWHAELEEIADCEGFDLWAFCWLYSPKECSDYLASLPGAVQTLIARAKWADACAGRRLRRVS